MTVASGVAGAAKHPGSAGEVLWVFTKLGLTSFGGPIAHLGFFRTEFVQRRSWVDEEHYADVVALSQFLPGLDGRQHLVHHRGHRYRRD